MPICYNFHMNTSPQPQSIIIKAFGAATEFGYKYLTIGGLFFKNDPHVFVKLEAIMVVLIAVSIGVLVGLEYMPFGLALVCCILLSQRILEYVIVYSRNFIFNRGRIFTHFSDSSTLGQWVILVFFLNVIEIIVVFAVWYRFFFLFFDRAFSQAITFTVMDSLYLSMTTFAMVSFGDIIPTAYFTKTFVMIESMLIFYTIIVVINGLISVHFGSRDHKDIEDADSL